MKHKVKVFVGDKVVFKGRLIEMPIKKEFIVKKSVELFDDDDPCIIHQSFVYKEFGTDTLDLLQANDNQILGKDYINELDYLDFPSIESISIVLQ